MLRTNNQSAVTVCANALEDALDLAHFKNPAGTAGCEADRCWKTLSLARKSVELDSSKVGRLSSK